MLEIGQDQDATAARFFLKFQFHIDPRIQKQSYSVFHTLLRAAIMDLPSSGHAFLRICRTHTYIRGNNLVLPRVIGIYPPFPIIPRCKGGGNDNERGSNMGDGKRGRYRGRDRERAGELLMTFTRNITRVICQKRGYITLSESEESDFLSRYFAEYIDLVSI